MKASMRSFFLRKTPGDGSDLKKRFKKTVAFFKAWLKFIGL